jgi:hypothetical protein
LIDCRFHEAGADSLTVAVTLAVIRNEAAIALNVRGEFLNRFEQLARGLLLVLEFCALQIHLAWKGERDKSVGRNRLDRNGVLRPGNRSPHWPSGIILFSPST